MKKRKQMLSLVLSGALLAGMLTGCGSAKEPDAMPGSKEAALGNEAADSSESEKEAAGETIEVSVAIWGAEDGLANPDDPILKQIEEKTGVKLVAQNITWDDASQKVQLWATNGQLPDIFVGDFVGQSFYSNWIEQGVIRALIRRWKNICKWSAHKPQKEMENFI